MDEQKQARIDPTSPDPPTPLGRWLEHNRTPRRLELWRRAMFAALGLIVLVSLFATNAHPHFGADRYPFFWPAFGLLFGLGLVLFVKKIAQPLIKRPEDYYGDL
ncbi:MAG: hypothetical protein LBS31_02315 [Candidatus Adiutrix sp.]|jgi:antibiotic biosynthesis monooxygenase (ABM) superfamily enzyme|nr:hypothetical protein [Candidatus Adiutrix sp.]